MQLILKNTPEALNLAVSRKLEAWLKFGLNCSVNYLNSLNNKFSKRINGKPYSYMRLQQLHISIFSINKNKNTQWFQGSSRFSKRDS